MDFVVLLVKLVLLLVVLFGFLDCGLWFVDYCLVCACDFCFVVALLVGFVVDGVVVAYW